MRGAINSKDIQLIYEAAPVQFDPEIELPPVPEEPGAPSAPEGKNFHDKTVDRHDNEQRNTDLRDALSRLNDWVDDKIATISDLPDDEIESITTGTFKNKKK